MKYLQVFITIIFCGIYNISGAQTTTDLYDFLAPKTKYTHEIIQVILYETGYLKSKSFREDNNLFGMQCPKIRKNNAIGCRVNMNGHQFALYINWEQSIMDFMLWMEYNTRKRPINRYKNFYMWLKACNWNSVNSNYYNILQKIQYEKN